MSINIGAAVNSAASWVGHSPVLNTAFGNPFIATLIITALIAIVLMATFHYKVTSINFKKSLRASFYIYCATLLVMYLHHYIVSQHIQETQGGANIRQLFGSLDLKNGGMSHIDNHFDVRSIIGSDHSDQTNQSNLLGRPNNVDTTSFNSSSPTDIADLHPVMVVGRPKF